MRASSYASPWKRLTWKDLGGHRRVEYRARHFSKSRKALNCSPASIAPRAPDDPVRGHLRDRPAPPPGGGPRAAAQGLHLLRGRAQGPDPRLRRALPRPSPRGREHPGRDAHGPGLRGGGAAARRARGHPHRRRPHQGVLRRGRAAHRRGRDQDQQDPVLDLRGAPGRELPQAAAGHGGRHPGHPGQARRPPAQHAHPPAPARGPPGPHRRRDHGHLRAPGRPAGHEQGQERARGPRLPVPGARRLQGAHRPGGGEAQEGHRVHREGEGHGLRAPAGRRPRRHPRGPHQAPLLDPPEAAPAAHRPRPGLRLRGPAHRGADHPRLLRRPRRAAQPLAAGAGADQGLHRDAAAQRLPVAAHLGDRGRGPSLRGPDPHPRDAPHRGGGDRRPLEVQGGAHRLQQGRPGLRLAAPAPRVAAGGEGPPRVPELAEARPLPRGGLLLHARGAR